MRPGGSQLTTGSIPRTLATFALPVLMGNLLQSLNGSINAIWVGNFLGPAAFAATANANVVMFLLLGLVFGITMASTILIAQRVGARDMDGARRAVGTSASFFLFLSLIFAALGLLFSPQILLWMDTPEQSYPLAVAYLRVMFLALPASYGFFFVMAALRGAGDAKTPFYFLVLAVALDIALNPLLIFGWGPFPEMGIAGSATATLVSQTVALVAMVRHIYRRRNPLALHRGERHLLRPDFALVRTLVVKGMPMGLQMIVLSMSFFLLFRLVNRFGADTSAAFAAAQQLWNYVQMPAMALGAAVSSMAAQNIGAGLWSRVSGTARWGVIFNFAVTGSIVLLLYLVNRYALGVFLPANSPALEIAYHLNAIILWTFPFFGMTMVLSGVVRAAGAVAGPLIILAIALLGVRIPVAYWTADRYGADGIWWSFAISALVAVVLTGAYYFFGSWRKARMVVGADAPRPAGG